MSNVRRDEKMNHNKGSLTIHDVAAAAGVSVSTVSRVLNDKDDVAPSTYAKVQDVIEEMGYTSSLAARSMRSRRTNVIGLVMPDVGAAFSVEIMKGVNQAIAAIDYDLIIYTQGNIKKTTTATQEQRYVALLNSSITDGVIITTPVTTTFSTSSPVVAIDPNNETPNCPAVIATNCDGALTAVEYLLELGHRRIAHISGRLDLQSAVRRLQGYEEGLRQAGIEIDPKLIEYGDYTTETGYLCAKNLLLLPEPPTAIFAANDQSAIGAIRAIEDAGLNVPDDISVIGFDNITEAAFTTPKLTTIDQSIFKMGQIATEMLIKLIEGKPVNNELFKVSTDLLVRDSCRSIK